MSKEKKELTKTLKTFYGVGDFGFSYMANMETYYFNYFLTNIAGFMPGVVSIITTVASLVDAGLSWTYGIILNKMKPLKWGRYRSMLLVVPWIVPFLYAFQFIRVGEGVVGPIVIVLATILSHIAWNIPFIANISMVNVVCSTQEERMALSSSRAIWNSLARCTYSYGGVAVVSLMAGWLGEKYSYGAACFCFGVLFVILYYVHFKMFDGYEESGEEEMKRLQIERAAASKKAAADKQKQPSIITCLATNPNLFFWMGADFTKYMYSFIASGIAVYYFQYVAKAPGLTATYILVSNLLAVAASYIAKPFAKKVGAKNCVLYTMIAQLACLLVAFALYKNTIIVMILMCLAQFFVTFSTAATPTLYSNCCIYSEHKTGVNATGTIMGFSNIPIKIGVVTRGIAISAVLAMGGFDPAIDPAQASDALMRGISIGFMIIPAAAILLGILLLAFGYRITDADVAKYVAEIKARKAAEK